ncbi:hypothetical protein [Noviherbaspirillum sp. UKPF54]|uniref:hypothetical protein n=1 Tax=Noviherbaspirillum sp. UKPF54 TaxID=2601898 RepID=UPI00143D1330|nr:hypothetical protein [Noviherbaspirillum sp. UKPF54]
MPIPAASNAMHPRGARNITVFFALSLLIHGLLFFVLMHQREEVPRASEAQRSPLSVRLLPAPPPSAAAPPAHPTPPPVARAAPRPKPKPAHKPAPKPAAEPKVAKSKSAPPKAAPREAQTEPPQQAERAAPPEMDMMSMLNAARARRRAAAMDNDMPADSAPSTNDIALANINRDLQRNAGARNGMGNVYVRLTRKGVRTAQFQIRGWNPVSGNRWSQTIDVDAGPDGDVELATVQKMIEWIRAHYSGDFNWESHRLDRVFTLSARPRDNAELQSFLMQEFFSG